MKLSYFAPIFFLVLVVGCTEYPIRETAALADAKEISIVVAANRFLELEPCGCAVAPWGGAEREYNAMSYLRGRGHGDLLSFSSGTTFLPSAVNFDAKHLADYAAKADFLVEALNTLKTSAVSPSADDLLLGLDTLRALQKKAAFPFISTNLVAKSSGKPIFSPFAEWRVGEAMVLVLGAARGRNPKYGATEMDVEVRDPAPAIRAVLSSLPNKPRFVVLLSSLTHTDVAQLVAAVPEINLVLGGTHSAADYEKQPLSSLADKQSEDDGTGIDTGLDLEQLAPNTLYFMPLDRGRNLGSFSLEAKAPGAALGNPKAIDHFKGVRAKWQKRGGPRMAALLKETAGRPTAVPVPSRAVAFSTVALDKAYDRTNPLTGLVARYKEAVRQRALRED